MIIRHVFTLLSMPTKDGKPTKQETRDKIHDSFLDAFDEVEKIKDCKSLETAKIIAERQTTALRTLMAGADHFGCF